MLLATDLDVDIHIWALLGSARFAEPNGSIYV
jgi:hypothetical protein